MGPYESSRSGGCFLGPTERRREKTLLKALLAYEQGMLSHDFEAMRGSLAAMERSLKPLAA